MDHKIEAHISCYSHFQRHQMPRTHMDYSSHAHLCAYKRPRSPTTPDSSAGCESEVQELKTAGRTALTVCSSGTQVEQARVDGIDDVAGRVEDCEVWLPTQFTTAAGRPICVRQLRLVCVGCPQIPQSLVARKRRFSASDETKYDAPPLLGWVFGNTSAQQQEEDAERRIRWIPFTGQEAMNTFLPAAGVSSSHQGEDDGDEDDITTNTDTNTNTLDDDDEVEWRGMRCNVAAYFSGFCNAKGEMIFL